MTLKQIEYIDKVLERDFKEVRKRVQKTVDASPKSVTLEDALKQVKKFGLLTQLDRVLPLKQRDIGA